MTMQMVLRPEGRPVLQQTSPVKEVEYCVPASQRLTVGKINLIRHHVKEAHSRPSGMFVLLDSRRP